MASSDTWEDDPGSYIDFTYEGSSTAIAPGIGVASPDYNNVVGWTDLSADYPNAIGITVVWHTRGRVKKIVDCDTVLNSNAYYVWTQNDISNEAVNTADYFYPTTGFDVDVQNIMTHEAGHWLMLDDIYEDAASEQTMYGYAGDEELKSRSLESGDEASVRKIYPQYKLPTTLRSGF